MHPIQILKMIASHCPVPQTRDDIERWISECIGESHFKVMQHKPFDDEHAKYSIESARHGLGKLIGDNSNMYPTWQVVGGTRELYMSALYFKNEYGKSIEEARRGK